jgi:hypothetical protein
MTAGLVLRGINSLSTDISGWNQIAGIEVCHRSSLMGF